ncbi:MAG: hypothetical protein ACI86H_000313 [bacterium]|jgi:hypothetical protein
MIRFFLLLFLSVLLPAQLFAEYRVYRLEIFDRIDKTEYETTTGFDPDQYIAVHGGYGRIAVILKASWHCYGDTSRFKKTCPMPKPVEPYFKVGEKVVIKLKKHITGGWTGIIELSLYREDLKSNVYGIRFLNRRSLYGRYFEYDLKSKVKKKSKPKLSQ